MTGPSLNRYVALAYLSLIGHRVSSAEISSGGTGTPSASRTAIFPDTVMILFSRGLQLFS